MVSKKDCAFWRVLRGRKICYERQGDHDPYQVNYNEPFRDQSEGGGVEYRAPLRAQPDAPVTTPDAASYKPVLEPEKPKPQPVTAVADATPVPEPSAAVMPEPPPKARKPKPQHAAATHSATKKKIKKPKPSPDQAAAGL